MPMQGIDLLQNAHWLVILGMVCALLGAIYSAFGLTQKYEPFANLTEIVTFGSLGGFILGLGLGFVGLLFVLLHILLNTLEGFLGGLNTGVVENPFLTVLGFFLIGGVLGMIFGFLIRFGLNRVEAVGKFPRTPRQKRVVFIAAFAILLVVSVAVELYILFFIRLPSQDFDTAKVFLDIPLLVGCLTNFLYYRQEKISDDRQEKISDFFVPQRAFRQRVFLLISYFLFILLIFLVILIRNDIFTNVIIYSLEFVFGFLIMGAINRPRNTLEPESDPSWTRFIIWLVVGSIWAAILYLLVLFHLVPDTFYIAIYLLEELALVIGLILGIRNGKIDQLVSDTNRPSFRYGFVVGLIVFGLYTSGYLGTFAGFFHNIVLSLYYLFISALIGSLPIGLLIGSINKFRGPIHHWTLSLSEKKGRNEVVFGLIGVLLTIIGILLLGLQALMV